MFYVKLIVQLESIYINEETDKLLLYYLGTNNTVLHYIYPKKYLIIAYFDQNQSEHFPICWVRNWL